MTAGIPTVSVVLPTYNRLRYLRPAVDSVFAQTFADWELIVADDGSDGETAAFLATLALLPRVKLLKLPHTGNPGAARNAALRAACGSYIAFLDSDDVWLPRKLEIQIDAQKASPSRRWSYTALTRVGPSGEVMPGEFSGRRLMREGTVLEQLLTLDVVIATPSVAVERSLMMEVGGFDEEQLFFEEYDMWLRLNLRSEVCAIPEPLVLVRNHDQHYSADRVGVYQARFRLLDKFAALAPSAQFDPILRQERAKTAAALAWVHAAAGRRGDALRMLWRSRGCAWQSRNGWQRAAATAARAIAPAWLRNLLRRHRSRARPSITGQA